MAVAGDASKKKYAYLDQLSTEDLKAILRASALSEEADDPALIDYALEVIMQREKEQYEIPDAGETRKEFDQLYRELESPLYPIADEEAAKPCELHLSKAQTKKRSIRRTLIAAAIIAAVIFLTCIPVFGYANVVQMVAYWTADQFGFRIEDSSQFGNLTRQSNQQLPEEYQELQAILKERGIQFFVPEFPEGFKAEEPFLLVDTATANIEFSIMYTFNNDYIGFNLTQNEELPLLVYEKNNNEIEQYNYAGVTFYIFKNTGTITAAWVMDNLGYCIFTNSPSVNVKDIIHSMYKE